MEIASRSLSNDFGVNSAFDYAIARRSSRFAVPRVSYRIPQFAGSQFAGSRFAGSLFAVRRVFFRIRTPDNRIPNSGLRGSQVRYSLFAGGYSGLRGSQVRYSLFAGGYSGLRGSQAAPSPTEFRTTEQPNSGLRTPLFADRTESGRIPNNRIPNNRTTELPTESLRTPNTELANTELRTPNNQPPHSPLPSAASSFCRLSLIIRSVGCRDWAVARAWRALAKSF